MIAVFWLEWPDGPGQGSPLPQHALLAAGKLSEALALAEQLRARRRAGEALSHVCIQSELTEVVGQAGVSDPPKDYAHYKRRLDPAIPLGRPPR